MSFLSKLRNNIFFGLGGSWESITPTGNYPVETFEMLNGATKKDLQSMRAQSNKLYQDNGFYRGFINTALDHTIGSGLKAKAAIPRTIGLSEAEYKKAEQDIDKYYLQKTSTNIDTRKNSNYLQLQRLIYRSWKIYGECFIYLPIIKNDINIQLIEPQNIAKINYNKTGEAISFDVITENGTQTIKKRTGNRINIIHLFTRERPLQIRGSPLLIANFRDFHNIQTYLKYEIEAAKLSALFFATLEQDAESKRPFGTTNRDFTSIEPDAVKKETTIKSNVITRLNTNEKMNLQAKGRDNTAMQSYVDIHLQKIASAIRIPVEVAKALFLSSYTASRGSMLLTEKFVRPERQLFNIVNKIIKEQIITFGIIKGDLKLKNYFENKKEYNETLFIGEPTGSIDRLKDAKALAVMVENNFETRTRATAELSGGEFETNVDILQKEQELLKSKNLLKDENDNNQS